MSDEHIENAKTILKSATKEHNDDCILCAMKDTRIGDAFAELEAAESCPKCNQKYFEGDTHCTFCREPRRKTKELEAAESKPVIWNRSKWLLLGRFKNWCWLGRLNEIKTTWQWQIVYHGDVTENKP